MTGTRILLVDDNEGARYSLARCLREAGYHVAEAESAAECLNLVTGGDISLIILDVRLPDTSGVDVCRHLKKDPATSHIPVIQTSAFFTATQDRIKGLESGADIYLTSPFEPQELLAQVQALLRLRQAEARLRDKEQWLSRLYNANLVGLVRGDFSGRIYEANDEFLRIVGYTRQDLETGVLNWIAITPPEHLPKDLASLEQLVKTGRHSPFEKEYIRRDGSRVPVLVGRSYLGHEMAFATVVDLSHQKRTEANLRESEERFRVMADGLPLIVWVHDAEGQQQFVNRTFCEFFGVTVAEMKGNRWELLLHPEDAVNYRTEFLKSVRERREFHSEVRVQRSDGTWRWLESWARPRLSMTGEFLGMVGTSADITDRKAGEEALRQAEQKLQQHAGALEKTVQERTASLQEMVHQLEQYSYSISHDMRAPLRAMNQYSQILLEDFAPKLGPEGEMYLERIASAALRLDRLISDVLTYHRLIRGEVRLEHVDLEQLTREIIQQYPMLQRSPVEVCIQSPLAPVRANVAALTQCLSNLLGNAVKFVSPGVAPHVTVRTEPRDGMVRIWVEDNGIGIHPHELHRIWDIFHQGHPGQGYEGTGIGLSIVKKAVERMGGQVGVESKPGCGSRFWFDLHKSPQSA